MLPIVDANVILRYLLNDVPAQAQKAKDIVASGCELTIETVAEVVYVLLGVYKVPRNQIAHVLTKLTDVVYVERADELSFALELFGEKNLDFVDCMLVAQNQINGRTVISFDKKLTKLLV